jgi:hypothetical protein
MVHLVCRRAETSARQGLRERAAELLEGAADALSAPVDAVDSLVNDLLRDPEPARDLGLREPFEKVQLDRLALPRGERAGDRVTQRFGVARSGRAVAALFVVVVAVR